MKGNSMKRLEVATLFRFLIGCFVRDKKRLPYHTQDLKDFFQGKGQALDLSSFYLLEIRPTSRETVRIGYSVRSNEYGTHASTGFFYESVEVTYPFSGPELFLESKWEWPPREFWDNFEKKIG